MNGVVFNIFVENNSDMKKIFKAIPNLKYLVRNEEGNRVDFRNIDIKSTLLSKNPSLIGHSYDYFFIGKGFEETTSRRLSLY